VARAAASSPRKKLLHNKEPQNYPTNRFPSEPKSVSRGAKSSQGIIRVCCCCGSSEARISSAIGASKWGIELSSSRSP
jgi:hypothetical protein